MKEYEELTFADNFMFCKILEENEYLCREMTELILGRKIGNIIKDPKTEKAIKLTPDGHGIRFDVYFEDDQDTIYDIEMQTSNTAEIPKRSRYYQGMLDLNYLKEGKRYKNLPSSYIIFLCTFDLFGMGYHKYSFVPMCREDKSIELEDGTNRIFICAGGHRDDVSKELAEFIEFLTGKLSENKLVKSLQEKVQEARESKKWRTEYMTLRDMLDDEFERGMEQGIDIGEIRLTTKLVCAKLKKGKTIQTIAEETEESEDVIRDIVAIAEKYAPDYDVTKIAEEFAAM